MNNERARIPDGVQARFFGMCGKLLSAPAKQASPEENLESASRSGEAGFAGEADHVVVANSDEATLTGAGALRFGLQQPSDRYTVEIVTNCVIFVSCLSFFFNSSYDRSNHLVTKNKDNPVSNVCLAGFRSE